jgi:hypothetical protein
MTPSMYSVNLLDYHPVTLIVCGLSKTRLGTRGSASKLLLKPRFLLGTVDCKAETEPHASCSVLHQVTLLSQAV